MICGRFAPSPSGRMHLGNAFSALLAWLSAKSSGGQIVLRIEDLDPARSRPEHAAALLEDFSWLGLHWDRRAPDQSRRGEAYAAALEKLRELGLLYPCFCSRDQLRAASAPHASDGRVIYAGTCLFEGTDLSEGRGTTHPFELIGAPQLNATSLANELNALQMPGVLWRAAHFTPPFDPRQYCGARRGGGSG